ncbi:hypothetical protein HanIR_Chr12g0578281 [Helianthus annuus]|nr:hypothetical protein HanIR_Chr12g0578281 [Helianthus annuus]
MPTQIATGHSIYLPTRWINNLLTVSRITIKAPITKIYHSITLHVNYLPSWTKQKMNKKSQKNGSKKKTNKYKKKTLVEKKSSNTRGHQRWTHDEEVALCKAFLHISEDHRVGNLQTQNMFWHRIIEHFGKLLGGWL